MCHGWLIGAKRNLDISHLVPTRCNTVAASCRHAEPSIDTNTGLSFVVFERCFQREVCWLFELPSFRVIITINNRFQPADSSTNGKPLHTARQLHAHGASRPICTAFPVCSCR